MGDPALVADTWYCARSRNKLFLMNKNISVGERVREGEQRLVTREGNETGGGGRREEEEDG